jgi:hypothetical protein
MEEFSLLIFKAVSSGSGSVKSNKQPDFSRYQPFISLSNLKKDKWIIPKDTPIVIGRSLEQCNIIINGFPNISRVHCVMWFDTKESAFCIKDYSSNGTFLETGKRLERETTHKLAPSQSFYLSSRDCLLTVGLEQ